VIGAEHDERHPRVDDVPDGNAPAQAQVIGAEKQEWVNTDRQGLDPVTAVAQRAGNWVLGGGHQHGRQENAGLRGARQVNYQPPCADAVGTGPSREPKWQPFAAPVWSATMRRSSSASGSAFRRLQAASTLAATPSRRRASWRPRTGGSDHRPGDSDTPGLTCRLRCRRLVACTLMTSV
jgi:hypothetical protein